MSELAAKAAYTILLAVALFFGLYAFVQRFILT